MKTLITAALVSIAATSSIADEIKPLQLDCNGIEQITVDHSTNIPSLTKIHQNTKVELSLEDISTIHNNEILTLREVEGQYSVVAYRSTQHIIYDVTLEAVVKNDNQTDKAFYGCFIKLNK